MDDLLVEGFHVSDVELVWPCSNDWSYESSSAAIGRPKDRYKTVSVVKSRELLAIRVIRVQVVRGPI